MSVFFRDGISVNRYICCPNTVNSLIRAQCAQTQHRCALIWKVEVESFPTVYDNPYVPLYRHVIYRWKALDLSFKDLKGVGAPLLEVRPYWGIYGISIFTPHVSYVSGVIVLALSVCVCYRFQLPSLKTNRFLTPVPWAPLNLWFNING